MNTSKRLFKLLSILLLTTFLITLSVQKVSGDTSTIIFSEDFTDGELNNNPVWSYTNSAWYIDNGQLHIDGLHTDGSGRYRTVFDSFKMISSNDYLEFSFRGMLKSSVNPQEGRFIYVVIGSGNGGYGLRIQKNSSHGAPINKNSISLGDRPPGTLGDLVVTDFVPVYDRMYEVRAIREFGLWTLFVDNILIGTAADT